MKPLQFVHKGKSYKTAQVSRLYLKLRSQFTVSFFLLVMLPFIIFLTVAYVYFKSSLEDNSDEMLLISLNQEKNLVLNYLDGLETSIGSFSKNPVFQGISGQSPGAKALENAASACFTSGQAGDLSAVYVISGNKIAAVFSRVSENAAISTPSAQPWYARALAEPDKVQVLGRMQRFYDGGSSKAVFSLAKAVASGSGKPAAVLLFDFKYDALSDLIEPGKEDIGEQRMIIDSVGNVMYSMDPDMFAITPEDGILQGIDGAEGFKRISYKDERVYMSYAISDEPQWTFLSLLPAKAVTGKLLSTTNPFLPICIAALVLILLIYLLVSSRLLSPINELTAVISDYEKGNFSDGPDRMEPTSEQALQGAHGNASEIDFLINKVYNIKLKQKEAELNSLQNQINPHFLYNTLESIRGAALYHGIHEIAAMSKALSLLFRYSISDRALVSIREEIQHLDNYMSIQNFRYENKFDLIYSIPPELYGYKILKLTLQPLIENSIKHGLEMKLGKGQIKVEMLNLESNIRILISDDGIGMPLKKVEELNRALSKNEYLAVNEGDRTGTGIGVKNVNSRIKLYFGGQYGLKFRGATVGTVVEITLPAVKEA